MSNEDKDINKNPEEQNLDDIVAESEETEKKEKAEGEEKPKIVIENKDTRFITKVLRLILKKLRILAMIFFTFAVFYFSYKLYKYMFGYYIIAQFEKLPPVTRSMPVYYKGFKVGQTGRIRPSKDFTCSHVKLVLDKDIHGIPDNITAKLKKNEDKNSRTRNYIDLEYPVLPATSIIRKGTVIHGETTMDMEAFMTSQADSGAFTIISDNLGKTFESAEKTSDEIRSLVADIRVIVQENRPYLKEASQNFAATSRSISQTAENINEVSLKLNRALSETRMTDAVINVDESTQSLNESMKNIQEITGNIDRATKNLDKTMSKIDQTIDDANQVAGGVKSTMSKRFGGVRLMLGTPVSGSMANAAARVQEETYYNDKPQEKGLPAIQIRGSETQVLPKTPQGCQPTSCLPSPCKVPKNSLCPKK